MPRLGARVDDAVDEHVYTEKEKRNLGAFEETKGKLKQAAGDLTDNDRLHDEGVADETAGKVEEGFGRGRRKIGEAVEDLGKNLKR